MRSSNTDNLFYGETLLDRLVWIDIDERGNKEKNSRDQHSKSSQANKAILQITNWRFIITFLGNNLSDHRAYGFFSWADIKELTSSSESLTVKLKDGSDILIKQEEAHIASIRLWALGEGVKTEMRNSAQSKGDAWEQSSSINFTCKTLVPYTGNWSLVLESYGIICEEGKYPRRLEWNSKLSVDIVKMAFSKRLSNDKALDQNTKTGRLARNTAENTLRDPRESHESAGNIIGSSKNDTDSPLSSTVTQHDSEESHRESKFIQQITSPSNIPLNTSDELPENSFSNNDSLKDLAVPAQEYRQETRLMSALELLLSHGLDKALIETLLNRGSIQVLLEGAEPTSLVDLNAILDTTKGIQINFIKEDASHPFVIRLIMRGLIGTVPCNYLIRASAGKEEQRCKFSSASQGSSLEQPHGEILSIDLIKKAIATWNYDLIKQYPHEFVTEIPGPSQGKKGNVRFAIDRLNCDQPSKKISDFIAIKCQKRVCLIPNISSSGVGPARSMRRSLAYRWGSGKNFLDLQELAIVRRAGNYYILTSEGRVAPAAEVHPINKTSSNALRSSSRTRDNSQQRMRHDTLFDEKKCDSAFIISNRNYQDNQKLSTSRWRLLNSYIYFWKRSFDFSGVISRLDFWTTVVSNGIALAIIFFILALVAAASSAASIACAATLSIYLLAVAAASLSLQARRIRDTGLSAWLLIALAVPYAGVALLIVYLLPTRKTRASRKGRHVRQNKFMNDGVNSTNANPPNDLDGLISDQSEVEVALKRLRDN